MVMREMADQNLLEKAEFAIPDDGHALEHAPKSTAMAMAPAKDEVLIATRR